MKLNTWIAAISLCLGLLGCETTHNSHPDQTPNVANLQPNPQTTFSGNVAEKVNKMY